MELPASLGQPRRMAAGVLDLAFADAGPAHGPAVVLLHGFPYDVHAYADVVPRLVAQGCRVITPWLRGYGPTRFLRSDTPRSGEQAALGSDLLALMDALQLSRAVLAGYDWGGRAACVVAALWPERCTGLVSQNGYNVHHIARAMVPASPAQEARMWYQYYLHCDRGQAGLQADRRAFCRLLWSQWSPTWAFDDACFARTAAAFDNPDFVEVVVHSYRHRFGLAAGDPALAGVEARLARQPVITVPTVTLDGRDDGIWDPTPVSAHAHQFTGPRRHLVVDGGGHNLPQECPDVFADAVLSLLPPSHHPTP